MSELDDLFRRVHAALEPGGLFLFDVATIGRGSGSARRSGENWWVESRTVEEGDTLVRRIRFCVEGRESDETHVLRLYDRDDVLERLEGPGFSTEALDAYCDFGFWPGYAGYAARKPGVS
jgi:hypothetical protein